MKKNLIKKESSNYEIEIIFTQEEKDKAKEAIIRHFGKDVKIPWFRSGNAPLNLIEEKLNPDHIQMWTYEELINKWLVEALEENKDIKFIWEPYDLQKDEENNKVSIKLDVYPEMEVIDNKRKTLKMWKIETKATDKEVEDSLVNLKKNYAEYKDTNKIQKDTVSKISLDFLDKDWASIETGTLFVWEPEFNESKFYDIFLWKEKGKDFEIDYKEKDLPPTFHKRKQEKTPTKIKITVKDIKQVVLPEFTEETIKKLFPDQKEIKNEEQLKEYIKSEIEKQKYDTELIRNVEEYINKIRDKNMKIIIPQTLIHQEFKSRMESLEKRFGSKEKVSDYFTQLWEEKWKQFVEDISKAAQDSLEKFFILQKITEELDLKIDRQKGEHLDAEKKLYEKVMW
jgi:trigger factor